MTTFQDLGLAPPLLAALTTAGYTTPTPIQAQAIPYVLAGKDVQGIAQTGTGKTAAFALPIIHRLLAERRQARAKRRGLPRAGTFRRPASWPGRSPRASAVLCGRLRPTCASP